MRHLNSAFSGGQDKRPKGASFETALCASHAPGFWAGIRIRSIRRICECRPQGASKKIGRKRPCASHAPCFWPAFCLGFWPACWPVFFFTVKRAATLAAAATIADIPGLNSTVASTTIGVCVCVCAVLVVNVNSYLQLINCYLLLNCKLLNGSPFVVSFSSSPFLSLSLLTHPHTHTHTRRRTRRRRGRKTRRGRERIQKFFFLS